MVRLTSRFPVVGGLIIALLAITSCSASDGYPIFEREATAADTLPADFDNFDDDQLNDYDLSTVRFAASYDGSDLYLVRSLQGYPCLAVANGDMSIIGCGGSSGTFGVSVAGVSPFEVGPAPRAEGEGWKVLAENIRVRESG